jgi:hypothetical protein
VSVDGHGPGAAGWLSIAVGLIVLLSGSVSALPLSNPGPTRSDGGSLSVASGPSTIPATSTPIDVTLTVNSTGANLSSQFWGTTVNNEVRMFRGESNAVNATPAKVLVWPGAMAGEDYDPFTQTHYNTYDGVPTKALTNESQFVQMCEAIHCTAIVQVPAEIDNPSIAEAIVNYTEENLSFTPAYWMIGNEPELWEHWKVPWADWESETTNGPDPNQFGHEVVSYVKAIRAVDPSTPILGLPASGCTCGYYTFDQWISGVLNVTGSKIQAVAFHEYPAGWLGTGNGSLQAFYGTLQGAAGIPVRVAAARAAVRLACPGCNVSVFISELGSALSWSSYGPYAIGFSGDLSLASQVTQAMDVNLTNIDLFATELATTNSWFNTTGGARPDYGLYTSILDHLGTEAFPASLPGLDSTVYGIDTLAPNEQDREDLLVMNDNITHAISFTPKFAGSLASSAVEAWSWNGSIHSTRSNDTTWVEPYTPEPVPLEFPSGRPGTYVLPPQSLVLFEAYPAGGSYVRVLTTGVPNGTAWYANVAGEFYSTTASNLSLLLPPGAYPVTSVPIPLPIAGREVHPSEQLTPFAASPFRVDGQSTNVTIPFVDQWRVNVSASPGAGGSATPDVGWWNASEPVTLTATPLPGYAFAGWSGWGPGSANGSGRSITIDPTGPVSEKARFVVGDEVELWAFGLPKGTPWSVTVRGFTTTSTNTTLPVYEPFGSYGFVVTPVPGYRSLPADGGFTVDSSWSLVEVRFVPITPPPPLVPVTFQASGLPASTPASITVRNSTETLGEAGAVFLLSNGSYAYHLGYVAGYHADVPEKTFDVLGGGFTVDVPFVPTVYPVTWQAAGTRAGLNWTVMIDGQANPATSAWLSTSLPNGTYPYGIELPSNYSATPRTGVVLVDGYSTVLPIVFNPMEFRSWFEVSGAPGSTDWSIRFGNVTHVGASNGSSFLAANGTYTFDVDPPTGYYAVPSHGTLTVAGPDPPTEIQFHPTSNRPSAALVAALSSGALWTSIWIGLSIFAGFAAVRGLRRRDGGRR